MIPRSFTSLDLHPKWEIKLLFCFTDSLIFFVSIVCVCVCVCVYISHSVVSNSLQPHVLYSLPGSSAHGIFQARILEWVTCPSPGIYLTQESNLGLLHCRRILYSLSHQRSPTLLWCISRQKVTFWWGDKSLRGVAFLNIYFCEVLL